MDIITIDWETYYDKDYSLSKIPTQQYLQDWQFEPIMVAVKVNNGPEKIHYGPDLDRLRKELSQYDWDNAIMNAHNVLFDGGIMALKLGIKPRLYFCTMMAARPFVSPFIPGGRSSLAKVAEFYNLPAKGTAVVRAIGKRFNDFTDIEMADYAAYCRHDTWLSFQIATRLLPLFPRDELLLIDQTIRKFTNPRLMLDEDVITKDLARHRLEKAAILHKAGLQNRDLLMSNDKFAAALKLLGVNPPVKTSKRTGKITWAFAKTDQGMKDLLEHNNPDVQALVAARLAHKSTIHETRLERFLQLAKLGEPFCVPLLYYAAHTGRLGGWDKLNLQNLTRGSTLRQAMIAPEGHSVVAGDLNAIEARILATLAGQWDLVQQFADDADPYSQFATIIFDFQVSKAYPEERFVGKTVILGCGYGVGGYTLYLSLNAANVEVTEKEALRIITLYRRTYPKIPELWKEAQRWLKFMAAGIPDGPDYTEKHDPIILHTNFKGRGPAVELPNGMAIYYPELIEGTELGKFMYKSRTGWKSIWGGAFVENICQALARIIISKAESRMAKHNIEAVSQVHDELVYVVPNRNVEKLSMVLEKALTVPVDWMPQLPLAAEVKSGANYAECK